MNRFTPRILISLVVLILIVSGGFIFFRSNNTPTTSDYTPVPQANNQDVSELGEFYDGTAAANPEASATAVPKPNPLSSYAYPNGERISSGSAQLKYETEDDVETVTNWYKAQIKKLKFNAQSFAATSVNGEDLNKISAAKPGEKIEVTIKKDQTTSNVLITVDRL